MILLTDDEILKLAKPGGLVAAMAEGLRDAPTAPRRLHYALPGDDEAKLLVMPAWHGRERIGLKLAGVMPGNAALGLPTVEGAYLLLDGQTASPLALLGAAALTMVRTAAVSALAAGLLMRRNARSLLIVGTGALSPHLARFHSAMHDFERVMIWGRSFEKAERIAKRLHAIAAKVDAVEDLDAATAEASVISCATSSKTPLIKSVLVKDGTHLDLVGSFSAAMREIEPALARRSYVVVDTPTALTESGDLQEYSASGGTAPTLIDLIRGQAPGRQSDDQITLFKSVGTASADLIAANHLVESRT
jgi:ornithine cyclodeaminase